MGDTMASYKAKYGGRLPEVVEEVARAMYNNRFKHQLHPEPWVSLGRDVQWGEAVKDMWRETAIIALNAYDQYDLRTRNHDARKWAGMES